MISLSRSPAAIGVDRIALVKDSLSNQTFIWQKNWNRNPLTDTTMSVALPNLDFKIECGDSVSCPDPQNLPVQVNARSEMIRQFEGKKHDYGDVKYLGYRPDLLAEIAALRKEIAAETPGGEGAFDWRVDFGEVFSRAQKGFDIVLANPPYVRGELIIDFPSIC